MKTYLLPERDQVQERQISCFGRDNFCLVESAVGVLYFHLFHNIYILVWSISLHNLEIVAWKTNDSALFV